MISVEQDQRSLCEIYYKFEEYPNPKKISLSDYDSARSEIKSEVRTCLERLHTTTIGTRSMCTAIRCSKMVYHRYCAICIGSEGFENKEMVELISYFVTEIASVEAGMLHEFRMRNSETDDVLIGKSIDSRKEMMLFIGKTAVDYFKSRWKKNRWEGQLSLVTAYIDESCRINPWRVYDGSLPEIQTSISYIICHGWIASESAISDTNTIEQNACLARWSDNPNNAAVEAINTVLESLLIRHEFNGNVVIFTDNSGAVANWRDNKVSRGLAGMFKSVTVSHIPREQNRKGCRGY